MALLFKLGARRSLRHTQGLSDDAPAFRSITLIKPVYGAHETTRECFESWLGQDFPAEVQTIFCLQDPQDPALKILDKLRGVYPFEVVIHPVRPGFGGKVSNLKSGFERAKFETLVFSDSDIFAPPGTLKKLIAEHQREKAIVSCLGITSRGENLWAKSYAIVWNRAILEFWAPLVLRNRAPALAGGTIALTKAQLQKIGGIDTFAACIAEDLSMGKAAREAGVPIRLGPEIFSPVGRMALEEFLQKLYRANLVVWSDTKLGTLAIFALTQGYWAVFFYALITMNAHLGAALAGFALLRILLSSPRIFVADALSLFAFFRTVLRPEIRWGGCEYRVARGGRLVARNRTY